MEGFFDMLNTVLMNVVLVGWALICIGIGLTIVVMMLDAFFGITSLTTKTSRKDTMHNAGAEFNCNTTDEAQHRFMAEHIRAHEDGVRLHDMAAGEAWDAHMTACDQHQAAVDMHNDYVSVWAIHGFEVRNGYARKICLRGTGNQRIA